MHQPTFSILHQLLSYNAKQAYYWENYTGISCSRTNDYSASNKLYYNIVVSGYKRISSEFFLRREFKLAQINIEYTKTDGVMNFTKIKVFGYGYPVRVTTLIDTIKEYLGDIQIDITWCDNQPNRLY